MFERSLISVRDFFVRNFFVKIIVFKSNDNDNEIWLTRNNFFINLTYYFLLLVPLVITVKIAKCFNYGVIYNYDLICYNSDSKQNKIIPIVIECKAYCSEKPEDLCDVTQPFKYYSTNIPLTVFATRNIPIKCDTMKIKYLKGGSIIENDINLRCKKNHLIYELFETEKKNSTIQYNKNE
jgi:hypothetical protein